MQKQENEVLNREITVRGEGSIRVEPTTALIQLEVVTTDDKIVPAQQENARVMKDVIAGLIESDVLRENIQTSSYSVSPEYDYSDSKNKKVLLGYKVSNKLTVQINEMNIVGNVIDAAVENGVDRVSSIEFTIEDRDVQYRKALSLSLNDALHKAHVLAETMNVKYEQIPIKIVELHDEYQSGYRIYTLADSNDSTPIEAGQIDVQATVEAVFILKQ